MGINWLDLAIAFLVALGAVRGFGRGLIREGMALLGLIAGLVAAIRFQQAGAMLLAPFIGPGPLADTLSFLGIVLLALGCATILTLIVRKLFRILLVGWLDRAAGGLLGAVQGAILAGLLLFLVVKTQFLGLDRMVGESELATAVIEALPSAMALLPGELGPITRIFTLSE